MYISIHIYSLKCVQMHSRAELQRGDSELFTISHFDIAAHPSNMGKSGSHQSFAYFFS